MKRILVCSDIHGELSKFQNVLDNANYSSENDQLILLGDYIDRGDYSKKVVEMVIELVDKGAIALKGNHEALFISSFEDDESYEKWLKVGGKRTIDSYNGDFHLMEKHADWMEEHLELYYETDEYIFVHAGLMPYEDLEEQEEEIILWSRNNDWIGLDKIVIHGHTPVDEVFQINDQINIDTGVCSGGKLTLLELPSMKIYED